VTVQIGLFHALKSVRIDSDDAAKAVKSLEERIAMKISEATKGLEAQLRAQNWLFGFTGALLAIIGLAPFIAKL
jgi:hypothetical protein